MATTFKYLCALLDARENRVFRNRLKMNTIGVPACIAKDTQLCLRLFLVLQKIWIVFNEKKILPWNSLIFDSN